MDLRLLRTFTVAARLLNFHKTAEKLYLAQPTVTAHIRQLEETLGTEVFDRTGKRVRLSPAGQRFLPHAEAVLAAYDDGVQDLLSYGQGYRSRLALAASPLIARTVLPRAVKRFTAVHPEVEISVSILLSPEIGGAVASGRYDLGLGRQPPGERDLEVGVLYSDPVIMVASADAGDLDAPPPDWEELLIHQKLLTHNHPLYWDDLLLVLRQRGLALRTMVVTQVDIAKRFIEEGLGVSFLPRSTVWRELVEGRLIEVPTPDLALPAAHTYLMQPAGQASASAAQAFAQTLRGMFAG